MNAVAPGPVEDELWTAPGGLADQIAARRGQTREEVLESTRSRRRWAAWAASEEVAATIAFLCSEQAANVKRRDLARRRRLGAGELLVP